MQRFFYWEKRWSWGYYPAKALGDAHECNVPPEEWNQKEMDLHNNHWGYLYALNNSSFTKEQFYFDFIEAYINNEIRVLTICD